MYCQVIVDIVHESVAKPFVYLIPDGMTLSPGQRVLVPFGHIQKEGIVVALSPDSEIDNDRVRPVLRPLDEFAAIPSELMELAVEMSAHCHCPMAETLRLMLPPRMRGGHIHPKTEKTARLLISGPDAESIISADGRSMKRTSLLRILIDGAPHTVRELSKAVNDPREALKKLQQDGIISLYDAETMRTPGLLCHDVADPGYTLTSGQKEALSEIIPALEKGHGAFLLHGVTGSGKTEVFMEAVREAIRQDKGAIILVPEIALTPQMVSWFRGRFGPVAAVIHSRLSAGERYDEWRRIRRGEARVVIGARSAVFAPVRHLGMIVIDEEHESTYLNDRNPRYDTRDIAMSRCVREGAVLILSSATPSILSFAKARRGDYILLEMPDRVNEHPLPEVEIVDMRRELESGNRTVLSGALREALRETVSRGEQAILLMNRRGYHSFVSCRSCGYVVKCPNCDISMTYHIGSEDRMLRCHYCGYAAPIPTVCPSCGGGYIKYFGAGTQKVEEEIQKLLPGIPTVRMDYDTTSGKDGHAKLLEEFRSGRARILVGTQMIAKGLDFPQVTLVGIVAADLALNLPDYRSRERAFQLFTQAAGRAGRGTIPGRVIIQTYRPDHPVIRFAARQDYRAFFESEFRRRRNGLYPPFTNLARILVESEREDVSDRIVKELDTAVGEILDDHPEWRRKILTINSGPPSVQYLRGKHRRQVWMKTLVSNETDAFFNALTDMISSPFEDVSVYMEVNPVTML